MGVAAPKDKHCKGQKVHGSHALWCFKSAVPKQKPMHQWATIIYVAQTIYGMARQTGSATPVQAVNNRHAPYSATNRAGHGWHAINPPQTHQSSARDASPERVRSGHHQLGLCQLHTLYLPVSYTQPPPPPHSKQTQAKHHMGLPTNWATLPG